MTFDPQTVREDFPALAITDDGRPRYYFDNPAGTQVPQSVIDAMADCLRGANANLGGYFETSERADAIVADARDAMADFVNSSSSREIVFGQNMTTLTFHLARSIGPELAPGDEIVLTRMDHDANVQPWRLMAQDHGLEIRWLEFDRERFEFDLDDLDDLLGPRTKLVCIAGASNLTGTVHDVATICERAKSVGALTFVDAVQSAPHVATDVQALGCDLLACSAYKFFGPHQGILWGRREVLERFTPYKLRPVPASIPGCWETGTLSHEGFAGTAAAVEHFARTGRAHGGKRLDRREAIVAAFDAIVDYEQTLSDRLVSGLQSLEGVSIQGVTAKERMPHRVPTVSFIHERARPDTIAKLLAARNFFVWSGHNYAVEAANFLGLGDGGAVRIGAAHYNTPDEVDQLLNALEDVLPAAANG